MNAQTAARQTSAPQTPSLPHAKPEALGLSTAGLQRMSDAFKREIDKGTVPGVTVLVARRGQIGWFEALGKQSPTAAAPMAHDTIFRIFSMTKPIVSIGIMMLVEEGRFILSDPVAKFIPEFADSKVGVENNGKLELVPVKRQMTVQDLLRHTSGLTYDHTGNGLVQQLYQQSRLRSRKITNAEHATMLAGMPLICQPGAEWNYSRSTDILGRIIEVISGKSLGTFLTERILAPLQMAETAFHTGEANAGRLAEAIRNRSLERRQGAALQHAGEAGDGIRRRRAGFDHHGLCPVQPDAAQRRYARRQQDHRPQDAGADGVQSSRPRGQDRLSLDAGRSRLRPRLRGPHPSGHGAVHGIGRPVLLERNGRNILLDRPGEDMFTVFMMQGPGQREYIRSMLRNLVYAAVELTPTVQRVRGYRGNRDAGSTAAAG